jgi:hypothetical protein
MSNTSVRPNSEPETAAIITILPNQIQPQNESSNKDSNDKEDAGSYVSSLTGHGYDQELVKELHHALNEL